MTQTMEASAPRPFTVVSDRIAAFARWAPSAVALEAGSLSVTYAAFDARANALARYLQARGVERGATVAVHLPRGIDQVICVAAAIKAGACFLPLEPSWPELRIRAVLDDAAADLVIGCGPEVRRLEAPARGSVDLDAEAIDIAAAGAAPVQAEIGPDDLAYVIYTSGSGGAPKGVDVAWRSFDHLIAFKAASFCMRPGDRVSHCASVAFDGALTEVWPALSVGATVVLSDQAQHRTPEQMRDWLVRERITVSPLMPPALVERMIVAEWPDSTRLRLMMTAGDALHVYPRPGIPFFLLNGYGPTECTVEATVGLVPTEAGKTDPPPIGRPIPGAAVYILDERQRPVEAGAVGEIYIGGVGVGEGYRNRPNETARRFQADPFREESGARMFRTGDLGAWRTDGQITFHGRVDDQLQIHGHRVEPGEVAAALAAHPLVASCAVTPTQGRQGVELLAYVVASAYGAPTASALQEFLAERLPVYMLPAAYIWVESLPLTINGKVDRAALPAPGAADVLWGSTTRAAETVAELRLAAMFADVLKRDDVGLEDDFFVLGGHDKLAAELTRRAGEAFGLKLAPQTLFETRTVLKLARRIEALAAGSPS